MQRTGQPCGGKNGGTFRGIPGRKRISRQVLEDYPAFVVVHHLDELKVAQAMRARPEARLVVVQKGSTVVLEEET